MAAAEDGQTKAEDGSRPRIDVPQKGNAAVPTTGDNAGQEKSNAPRVELPEADDFGLPVRPPRRRRWSEEDEGGKVSVNGGSGDKGESESEKSQGQEDFEDAPEEPGQDAQAVVAESSKEAEVVKAESGKEAAAETETTEPPEPVRLHDVADAQDPQSAKEEKDQRARSNSKPKRDRGMTVGSSTGAGAVSEWSHQQLAPHANEEEDEKDDDGEWKAMPAFATHRIYDDWGKVLAKEYDEQEDEQVAYGTLGGAGKGYTRVQVDDDADSATSMDDNTAYLFKDGGHKSNVLDDNDDEGRDLVSQMQTTKELLTEGQRIAYVGVVRLAIGKMLLEIDGLEKTKGAKKQVDFAEEAMKMWGQKMMVHLYRHMEIDSAEQVMVEQLAEHGVLPSDLTPALMQNARVRNPAKVESETSSVTSARPSLSSPRPSSTSIKRDTQNLSAPPTPGPPSTPTPPPPSAYEQPPTYEEHTASDLTVQDPSQIQESSSLDLDIRWTVLCDLFLLLIADSTYDSRSRTLLEHVGAALAVEWQEVCRFEKRVTDALEMQEQADKENWNEAEHLDARRKAARRKRMMVMGLCTVGGGLVIGLSSGLLAPVIGAGLAAGFTSIGVAGTSTFLGGAGAAALIGTAGTATGSFIGIKASHRRTGAVRTFEYRPLFNNKRTNLVVTVSGWMTGNVDDVRLPFSTLDPVMGDIYSVNWEPEMLQSTGQTIQILATEALTQTIQQILGATILATLMAGLSPPIVLAKLAYLIDNPWTVSLARADATGLILADSLIDRNLGVRPITLVGFSLGSRVIFSCLKELAGRGALGLVQNVYLFGSPIVQKKDDYLRARSVVSGRFVNGYATNDWILGYLFRATSGGIMRVSGLRAVEGVAGIENRDLTEIVKGHMAYRGMMPTLLQECGWLVDGLEFSEIEDPDPENHQKRQRELIDEIEAARRELDEQNNPGAAAPEKKNKFRSFFSLGKKAAPKKEWETYDERSQKVLEGEDKAVDGVNREEAVMFDVEAIRQEALKLALQGGDVEEIKAHLDIREIESTLPTLRLTSSGNGESAEPHDGLRQTKSFDGSGLAEEMRSNGDVVAPMANGHAHIGGSSSSTPSYEGSGYADAVGEVNEHLPPYPRPEGGEEQQISLSFEDNRPGTFDSSRSNGHSDPRAVSEASSRHPSPSAPKVNVVEVLEVRRSWNGGASEQRPPLKSVATTPADLGSTPKLQASNVNSSPNHNPWAGEEEEFGREKEVSMSFE